MSSSDVYKLIFYLAIVNKTYVTVTLGWHDSTTMYCVVVEPVDDNLQTNINSLIVSDKNICRMCLHFYKIHFTETVFFK